MKDLLVGFNCSLRRRRPSPKELDLAVRRESEVKSVAVDSIYEGEVTERESFISYF